MTGRSCEVDGCVRPPRSGRAPHCEMAYSDDVDAYEPRCSPCHWVYDNARAST